MKLTYLILAFMLTSTLAFSGDLIIKKSGERIHCVIQKEDSSSVEYTIPRSKHKSIKHKISKTEIDSIGRNYYTSKTYDKNDFEERPSVILGLNYHSEYVRFLGLSLEFPIADYFGAHIVGSPLGVGVGFDFHLSPGIRSSGFNFSYMYQDFGYYNNSCFIGSFTLRSMHYIQLKAGGAYHMSRGSGSYGIFNIEFQQKPAVSLLLGAGIYYPF
jgi:hypothetical protein